MPINPTSFALSYVIAQNKDVDTSDDLAVREWLYVLVDRDDVKFAEALADVNRTPSGRFRFRHASLRAMADALVEEGSLSYSRAFAIFRGTASDPAARELRMAQGRKMANYWERRRARKVDDNG